MLFVTVLPCAAVRAWHSAHLGFQVPGRCSGHPMTAALRAPRPPSRAGACGRRDARSQMPLTQNTASGDMRLHPKPMHAMQTCMVASMCPNLCQCPATARIVGTLCRNPAGGLRSPNAAVIAGRQSGVSVACRQCKPGRRNPFHCFTNKVPGHPQLPDSRKVCWKRGP